MLFSRGSLPTLFVAAAAFCASLSAAPVCDPGTGGLTLPQGFCALVVADGLGAARHIAVASNGDVYVALRRRGAARHQRRRQVRHERALR